MRLFGLIGFPLSQSFSKKYFEEKFEKEGLNDCRFENFPLKSVDEFTSLIDRYPELEGLAVTIPYKQQVLPFLSDTENIPRGLMACNCIKIDKGTLTGFNTDHIGFTKSLQPLLKPKHRKALILGNGGATAAAAYALRKLNLNVSIVSRNRQKGSNFIYQDLDEQIMREHLLIVNTTPLGMYPDIKTFPEIPYQFLTTGHLLFDMVYNPLKTEFLKKGEELGAEIMNGYEMLVLQAEENWKIWNSE